MTESVPPGTEIAQLSFERALQELEKIVTLLERGDVALEDSIRWYERGAALKAHCEQRLKDAQLKVEQIVLRAGGEVASEAASFE